MSGTTDLTPSDRSHALATARAILAEYQDAQSSALSREASEKLVDTSLDLASALIASEKRTTELEDTERWKDDVILELMRILEQAINRLHAAGADSAEIRYQIQCLRDEIGAREVLER